MASLNKAIWMWRQVKRVVSVGLFGGGVYLLWSSNTSTLQEPVILFFGALLLIGGVIGVLFPSKMTFFGGSGDDAY